MSKFGHFLLCMGMAVVKINDILVVDSIAGIRFAHGIRMYSSPASQGSVERTASLEDTRRADLRFKLLAVSDTARMPSRSRAIVEAISPEGWSAMASPAFTNANFGSLTDAVESGNEHSALVMHAISPEVWEAVKSRNVSRGNLDKAVQVKFNRLMSAVRYAKRGSVAVMQAIPKEAWEGVKHLPDLWQGVGFGNLVDTVQYAKSEHSYSNMTQDEWQALLSWQYTMQHSVAAMKAISPEAWQAVSLPSFSGWKFRALMRTDSERFALIMASTSPEAWKALSSSTFSDNNFGRLFGSEKSERTPLHPQRLETAQAVALLKDIPVADPLTNKTFEELVDQHLRQFRDQLTFRLMTSGQQGVVLGNDLIAHNIRSFLGHDLPA